MNVRPLFNAMTSRAGTPLPLEDMALQVHLRDCFAFVEQTQIWHNAEDVTIEALYCFPLPVHATLLGVTVMLNERLIEAQVAERHKAEQAYEQAMVDGDTAMLLEQTEPGLYNINLGNLQPADRASVHIRYALPLQWESNQLRLALPTAIAPRYGNPASTGMQPQHYPQADMTIEHSYRLDMQISGVLADAKVTSPSHTITQSKYDDGNHIRFTDTSAAADRDLVITLVAASTAKATASLAQIDGTSLLHSTFHIPATNNPQNLALKVLVDCSGSMAGESISLARRAALHALMSLGTGDSYAITAFGSEVEQAPGNSHSMQPMQSNGIDKSTRQFTLRLKANLGGTDMINALDAVFALSPCNDGNQNADILLITDGQTWERDETVRLCRANQHRVFVIGCGACPTESVVREIAEATGGAATFVTPGEHIADVVDRHLKRMRQARITRARLSLTDTLWQTPNDLGRCIFPDSTLHVFSALTADVTAPVELSVEFADGSLLALAASVSELPRSLAPDLMRVAADNRIREMLFNQSNPETAYLTTLAVEHQLISPFTHYLMVEKRGDAVATEAPALRQVPGMLAAGWGGVGIISLDYLDMPQFMRRADPSGIEHEEMKDADIMYSMKSSNIDLSHAQSLISPQALIELFNGKYSLTNLDTQVPLELSKIAHPAGAHDGALDLQLLYVLKSLIDHSLPEPEVIMAFWLTLLEHPNLGYLFSRSHRRAILRAQRSISVNPAITDWLEAGLRFSSANRWSWKEQTELPRALQKST